MPVCEAQLPSLLRIRSACLLHHTKIGELPRQPCELPRQPWELPRQPWELPRQPWELPRQPWELSQPELGTYTVSLRAPNRPLSGSMAFLGHLGLNTVHKFKGKAKNPLNGARQ
jgi:hypothetical protein